MRKDLHAAEEAPLLKNILSNAEPFRKLTPDQIERLAGSTRLLRARGGHALVEQGVMSTGLHVVIYGHVKVCFKRSDGSEKVLAILSHNDCFGLSETILGRSHQAAVTSLGDAMIVCAPKAEVFALAQENFDFAQQLLELTARQMHCLVNDINRYTAHDATQRVVGFLLRQHARCCGESVELCASKALIASRLGITGETFSRILHEFSAQGLIAVQGRKIRILAEKRLARLQAA